MMLSIARHDGHLASEIMRPLDQSNPIYSLIINFRDESSMRSWLNSIEHQDYVNRIMPHMSGPYHAEVRSALGGWVPPVAGKLPPKYKSVLATFLGLYPLFLVLRWTSGLLTRTGQPSEFDLAVRLFVSCALMTWFVMPFITRILSSWLYGSPPETAARTNPM